MKKILFIVITIFTFILNVNAETTPNGVTITETDDNEVSLYCKYSPDYWILITKGSSDSSYNVEPDGYDSYVNYFIKSDGSYDCPKYAEINRETNSLIGFVNDLDATDHSKAHFTLKTDESECSGPCNGNQTSSEESLKTVCDYSDAITDNGLIYSGEGKNCTISYNSSDYNFENNSTCAMINASGDCPDIFFNPVTKDFRVATYNYSGWFNGNNTNYDPDMFNYICGGNTQPRYFCGAMGCKIPENANINCLNVGTEISGSSSICSDNNVLKVLRFVGYLLFVAKLLIPIILIIMGSIDFGKAVVSSDSDSVKKASNTFMRRVIAGIFIFLIPTIVNVVFKGLLHFSTFDEYNNCRICIFNPTSCNISDD